VSTLVAQPRGVDLWIQGPCLGELVRDRKQVSYPLGRHPVDVRGTDVNEHLERSLCQFTGFLEPCFLDPFGVLVEDPVGLASEPTQRNVRHLPKRQLSSAAWDLVVHRGIEEARRLGLIDSPTGELTAPN